MVKAHFPDLEMDDPNAPVVKLPDPGPTIKSGLHFLLPVVLLIWCLMIERMSPSLAAFWAVAFMIFILLTQRWLFAFFRRQQLGGTLRRGLAEFYAAREAGEPPRPDAEAGSGLKRADRRTDNSRPGRRPPAGSGCGACGSSRAGRPRWRCRARSRRAAPARRARRHRREPAGRAPGAGSPVRGGRSAVRTRCCARPRPARDRRGVRSPGGASAPTRRTPSPGRRSSRRGRCRAPGRCDHLPRPS